MELLSLGLQSLQIFGDIKKGVMNVNTYMIFSFSECRHIEICI